MATYRKRLGRWRAEVARAGVRESKTFDTKPEATAWATHRESELLHHAKRARARVWTVQEALQRYSTDVSPTKRGARWERLRLALIGRDAGFASHRLRDLEPADVAAWRDRRLKEVAPASVLREMKLLNSVFEAARRDWGWIKTNPLREVRKPTAPAARDRRISDDEAERICCALGWTGGEPTTTSQRIGVMFRVALETAMRAGELVALTWDRVNLQGKFVQLERTKNGEARQVPLSREAIRLLQLLPRKGRSVFDVAGGTRDLLFRRARDSIGINDLRFHDARHEAITRLARKVDVLDLARMVGHRDLKSLRVYYNATATEIADRLG